MLPPKTLITLAVLISSGVIAAPWNPTSRYATHRVRAVGPDNVKLTTYHPPGVFQTFGAGIDLPLSNRSTNDISPSQLAQQFLEEKLGVTPSDLLGRSGHASGSESFEYFSQAINGLPVANAVANVAMKDGKVVSYGANFVKPNNVAPAQPKLLLADAILKAEQITGAKFNNQPAKLEYVITDAGDAVLVHTIQVQNSKSGEWYEVFVDATTGNIPHIVNFVADASYRVVPLDKQDPHEGYSLQIDPSDKIASPNGWHAIGTTPSVTSGNNVVSYKSSKSAPLLIDPPIGLERGASEESSATENYDYPYIPDTDPSEQTNVDAARVNAFYTGNMMHDLTYRYGFTESAYNFQKDNYGKGGIGGDRVQISVQDGSGKNNANFATPPDGLPGQMRMFTWDYTSPHRDGALENDIVVHEYGHGVSNRLTGGGTGRCLQSTEAGGMGEGWSDALAEWTELSSSVPDFTLGKFVVNDKRGIRSHPYSTNMTTNPLTYASLKDRNEVHAVGEVWAVIWHGIFAAMISKHGFTDNKFDIEGTGGNIKAMRIFIAAFMIQPCSPTFLSARDAIIQADVNKFGGANKCLLWRAFAKRGLGTGATSERVDNADIPPGC
ncbi:extracellular metalloproteinase MEP [Ceratobasidium sp. AG-Ba]|nr:extracellular metalloproteinase MEP [Ceratobasidium sp. AG-Ba]